MADQETVAVDWEDRAKKRVLDDFTRAKRFLDPIHQAWLSNYEHYRSGQTNQGLSDRKSSNLFPVPFTTEQIDTFCAMINDKLFHQGNPCTIYPREETDEADADAKQAMFDYHDEIDDVEGKIRAGTKDGALYGIIPFKVDYQERTRAEVAMVSQTVIGEDGQPTEVQEPQVIQTPEFIGAAVTKLDPFDTFFVPEKCYYGDGHPVIVRTRKRPNEFTAKYFFNQDKIRKKDTAANVPGDDDRLKERRKMAGQQIDEQFFRGHCVYLEWQGYYDPDEELESPEGEKMTPGHYVIGVVTGTQFEDVLVRFDKDPLKLGKENILIGNIEKDDGSQIGYSLIDKFHALQHLQDSLMGMLLANMKQQVKRPKIVNRDAIIDAAQINTTVDETIEVSEREDVTKAIYFPDMPNISPDIYNGLSIARQMGQNATRIHDTSEGKTQEGVETLGEAQILMGGVNLAINEYLKAIETTLIKPLYDMRNTINARFMDIEYVIRVVGEKGIEWKTIEPGQIRASVDFVCEASSREMERGVVAQQILQSLEPMMALVPVIQSMGLPAPRPDMAMSKLFEQWTWSKEEIEQILPSTLVTSEELAAQQLRAMQQTAAMGMPGGVPGQVQGQPGNGGGGQLPQPRNEQEVQASAQGRNQTQVGRM